jgi:hypothetical protein
LTDPASNPGLSGERPATSSLSHDTAMIECYNTVKQLQTNLLPPSYKYSFELTGEASLSSYSLAIY